MGAQGEFASATVAALETTKKIWMTMMKRMRRRKMLMLMRNTKMLLAMLLTQKMDCHWLLRMALPLLLSWSFPMRIKNLTLQRRKLGLLLRNGNDQAGKCLSMLIFLLLRFVPPL